jgi:hypothetical protein
LGARKGRYDGMPEQRTFGIFLHGDGTHQHGASPARPNQTIRYNGQPVVIKLETTHN